MRLFNYVRDAVAFFVVFSGLWLGNGALADPITVPTGLSVGDQYRLVFVTSTVHNAFSSDISTYNSIVDALGDTAIASDWKVIGSTATVDAIDNTATPTATSGVSIWRLDDVKVADDYADLWDGSLDAAIAIDETNGPASSNDFVWTGTDSGGGIGLGAPLGSGGTVLLGDRTKSDAQWSHFITVDPSLAPQEHQLYAMSGVFTVEAVPEPSSAILLGLVAGGGLIRSRRKRRQASSTV